MSFATDLAADWRRELKQIEESIPMWEAGHMSMLSNGVDTTQEHIKQLYWLRDNLEKGIRILEGRDEA